MEIAVLGSEDFVLGFRLAGLRRALIISSDEEYAQKLEELMEDENVGIVAVDSADLARLNPIQRRKTLDSIRPVVIPIGRDESDLREKVKRAIGIDLYKTEDD